ncbi:MAG: PEP-CTERM sorting domain-containing protein [Rhodanobacter sp.]
MSAINDYQQWRHSCFYQAQADNSGLITLISRVGIMFTKLGSKGAGLALAAAVAAISFVPAAQATPMTYGFTVTVTDGPLAGNVQNGSFSFDSGSVTPGNTNSTNGLLTAFDFTFNGMAYDAGTANTGALGFDAAGNLNYFFISSSCPLCTFAPGTENFTVTPGQNGFIYSTASFDSYGFGDVTYASTGVHVPEPGALGLFGFGLLLLGGVAARRRLASRRFG